MADENKQSVTDKNMKTPLTISAVIHIVVILLVIFGLPHFMDEPKEVETIPIDMVADISELTTTNKPPVKAPEPKEKKEEPPKAPPKVIPPKAQPPKQSEPEPKPPEEKELKEPPKEKPPEQDDLAPPKKEEKKPDPPKEKPKPKPEPKKEEPKKEDDSQDFDKLLNNLAESEPPQPDTPTEDKLMTEPTPSPDVSRFSDNLSISEMDALRQQLAGCWNINPGLMNAQDLAVQVRVKVNPDRTVAGVEIVDQARYNSDTMFRTMADSALRAVQSPKCSPLRLPADKYNLWNSMTIVFDPKEMF